MTAQPGGRRSIGLRDWFGDAQRRIARLGASGPMLRRRAIYQAAAPLGIALLQRGVRARRRAALATTVRAPETRLTLRHPLRPGRAAEPRFTVQGAPAASLAVRAASPDQPPAPPAPSADEPGGGPRVEAQASPQPPAPPAAAAPSTSIAAVGRAVRTLLRRVRGAPPAPQSPAPQPPTAEPPVDDGEPSSEDVAPVLDDEQLLPPAEDDDERLGPAEVQPSPRDAGDAPSRASDGPPQSDLVLRAPARAEAPPAAPEPPAAPAAQAPSRAPAPLDERPVEEPARSAPAPAASSVESEDRASTAGERSAPPPPAAPGEPSPAEPASEALDEPLAASTPSAEEAEAGDQRAPIAAAPSGPPAAQHEVPGAGPAPEPPAPTTPRSKVPAALSLVARIARRLAPREPERAPPAPPRDPRGVDALTEPPPARTPARPEAPVEPPAAEQAPATAETAAALDAPRAQTPRPSPPSLVGRVVQRLRPAAPPIERESRAADQAETPPLDERGGEDDRAAASSPQSSVEPPVAAALPPISSDVPSEAGSDVRPDTADGTDAVAGPPPPPAQRSPIARVLRRLAARAPGAQAEPRAVARDAPQPPDRVDAEVAPAGRPEAGETPAPRIERPLRARPAPVAMIARAARRLFAAAPSPDPAPPERERERPYVEGPSPAPIAAQSPASEPAAAAAPTPPSSAETPDAPETPRAPSTAPRPPLIARLTAALRPRRATAPPERRIEAPPPPAADERAPHAAADERIPRPGVPAAPLVARRPAGVPAARHVEPAIRVYRRPAAAREAAASSGSSERLTGSLSARDALALLPGAADEAIDDEKAFAISRSVRGPVAVARTAAVRGEPAASPPAEGAAEEEESTRASQPDLERLARQVYSRLRDRLLIEGERAGRGYRWF